MILKRVAIGALVICSLSIAGWIGYNDYSELNQLYFSIDMQSSQPGVSQIFFDVGRGHNEQDSSSLPIRSGAFQKYSFSLPAFTPIKSIRFDPTNVSSVIRIKKAGIENAKGETLKNFPVQFFKSIHQISRMDISKDVLTIHPTENANDPITVIEDSSFERKSGWIDFLTHRLWIYAGYSLLMFIIFLGMVKCRYQKIAESIGHLVNYSKRVFKKGIFNEPIVNILLLLICALLITGVIRYKDYSDRNKLYFVIDMDASTAGTSQIFFDVGRGHNEQDSSSLPIRSGAFQKYSFSLPAFTPIKSIRFDPTNVSSVIRIKKAGIENAKGETLKNFPVQFFKSIHQISRMDISKDVLTIHLTKNANDPITVIENSSFERKNGYAYVLNVANVVFDLSRFNIIVGLYFLCLILASIGTRSWAHVGIVSAVLIGLICLSKNVAMVNFGSISVSKAVGLAAFSGHSLTPNLMFIALSTLLTGIAAGAVYFLNRKRLPLNQTGHVTDQPQLHWWLFGVFFILVAAVIFPDVIHEGPRHANFGSGMYVPQWDSDNAVTWAYMIKNGYLPFKDFWYPYALSFAFDLASPWGNFLRYFVLLSLFGAFFYFISIVSRSAHWVGVIMITAFLLGWHSLFPQPERHLFPFVICLAYIVASGSGGRRQISIWPFWLATCVGLVFEPSQVTYAVLGVALVLLFDVFEPSPFQWRALVKRLVRDFSVPAVFLCIMVIILAQAGVIQNISDFYLEMGAVSNYMALPTILNLNAGNIAESSFFLVACPFVILALGIFERTLTGNRNDLLPKAIMAVGAIGVMQLQKHGVRPIDWQLFYSSAIGIVLYSVLLSRRMGKKIALLFRCMVGLCVAIFFNAGVVNQSWQRLVNSGQRVTAAVHVMAMDIRELAAYRADQLSPARFKLFNDEAALLDGLKSHVGYMPDFYSLTDAPILYLLVGAKPPYQINGFSMSPIFEQIKMVDYLRLKKIEYIIVEPSKIYFDCFSYYVRLPVLYNYVVSNYVPDFATQRFSVFRLRKPGEIIALAAWMSIFGDNVNLGHLPRYSAPPESPLVTCEEECEDILKVTISKIEQKQPVTIPFIVNGMALGVSFVAVLGKTEYWIKLNRIWFWTAQADGASMAQLGQIMPEGLSVLIIHTKKRSPEHLY